MFDKERPEIYNNEIVIPLTGNSDLDAEHSRLVKFISKLAVLSREGGSHCDKVKDILTCLLSLVDEHFEHEYIIMKQYRYHNYEAHRQDHQIIADELFEFVHRVESLSATARGISIRYIISWFQMHVQTHDVEFCKYIAESTLHTTG